MNTYEIIIALSSVIILSFFFNVVSKRTKIPSVLMLMVLGIVAQNWVGESQKGFLNSILPILGNVGLIMIVLEAALDLELKKEKRSLILKSLGVATLALFGSSFGIAFIIQYLVPGDHSFVQSLTYAIPLSIMSSAIIIPSVGSLRKDKKEFMVYESTFSDILGIMFFYFLVGSDASQSSGEIVWSIFVNILLTILMSGIVAYGLVYLFQKLKSQVKLFLIISVLMLMYAVGKSFHLSALVIILAFGLVLNNTNLFFRGKLSKYVNEDATKPIMHDFHIITLETAFVIRTFFFVIFGLVISLESLIDVEVALISLAVVGTLFLVRYITLKIFVNKYIMPELLLAPRGLITVLLFFVIIGGEHNDLIIKKFDPGILLYTIIITSIVMAIGLIANRGEKVKDVLIDNVKKNLQDLRDIPKTVIQPREAEGIDVDIQKKLDNNEL